NRSRAPVPPSPQSASRSSAMRANSSRQAAGSNAGASRRRSASTAAKAAGEITEAVAEPKLSAGAGVGGAKYRLRPVEGSTAIRSSPPAVRNSGVEVNRIGSLAGAKGGSGGPHGLDQGV